MANDPIRQLGQRLLHSIHELQAQHLLETDLMRAEIGGLKAQVSDLLGRMTVLEDQLAILLPILEATLSPPR